MKVEYRAWIDDMSAPIAWGLLNAATVDQDSRLRRQRAVHKALSELEPLQRKIITQHYFEGEPLSAIAVALELELGPVVIEFRQGVRILRCLLADFVAREFRMEIANDSCVICSSGQVAAIEAILRSRSEEENYARVIGEVYRRYGLKLQSPQTIVGHLKYHCCIGEGI